MTLLSIDARTNHYLRSHIFTVLKLGVIQYLLNKKYPKVVTLLNGTIGYALGRTYILFLCMIFVLLVQKTLNQLMTDDS